MNAFCLATLLLAIQPPPGQRPAPARPAAKSSHDAAATLRQLSDRLQREETVTVRGPVVLGHHGASIVGRSRGASKLIIEPALRAERDGALPRAAILIDSCADVTLSNMTIEIRGRWQYGLLIDRREKERAAHGLVCENVNLSGEFAEAAFGDFAAEVYTLSNCGFTNKYAGTSVFQSEAIHRGEIWSNASKRIHACSFAAYAPVKYIFQISAATHNIAFRDCEVSANVKHEALFAVGSPKEVVDPVTEWLSKLRGRPQRSDWWDIIGHLVIDGGHFETRGCRAFMVNRGNTTLRSLALTNFMCEHMGDAPFSGFAPDQLEPRETMAGTVHFPKGCTASNIWFRKRM